MTLTLEILAGVLALNVIVGGLMLRRGFIRIRIERELVSRPTVEITTSLRKPSWML